MAELLGVPYFFPLIGSKQIQSSFKLKEDIGTQRLVKFLGIKSYDSDNKDHFKCILPSLTVHLNEESQDDFILRDLVHLSNACKVNKRE
ncbi:MAG: hypothetical protein CSA39_01635 [Flavobacteriales bacterium]|nr:MAG: hypothetical protein CSA39_01635 [Flavobacteriales bacterium]